MPNPTLEQAIERDWPLVVIASFDKRMRRPVAEAWLLEDGSFLFADIAWASPGAEFSSGFAFHLVEGPIAPVDDDDRIAWATPDGTEIEVLFHGVDSETGMVDAYQERNGARGSEERERMRRVALQVARASLPGLAEPRAA